ncbi:unnamed protein product [Hymenolepis diminuta]|uniref:CYTOSOL_AP domain-containing protein n=1 Tax=Hymenolepis diminuta TaxID=6216 RepID=A0A0R3SAA8_HYMDI|nr:unnamed protein product [Hymenolepis diminuta]VUZ45345.1 unnamed protein product [Hymenolepis diminuta]
MYLEACSSIADADCDVVVFVNDGICSLGEPFSGIEKILTAFEEVNPKISESCEVLAFPEHKSKRLIYAPTGKLNIDTADSRNIYDAAYNALIKAYKIGCRKPLLVLGELSTGPRDEVWMQNDYPILNAILGALYALYTPLEIREAIPKRASKFDTLLVFGASEKVLHIAHAMEEGRRVTRDIAGSDPERMAAIRIVEYLKAEFANTPEIEMDVKKVYEKEYPLMAAVNRAASGVPRHDGRVVHLKYTDKSTVDTTLFLVGKGITYDTGGIDVKAGGNMAGMHRDKGGAASVAGFFKTLSLLKPKGLCVRGSMALVRNSIGSDGYVADEIITSRAGRRIRVGNTDAEGRMVMTDLLCEAKELALKAVNPFLFTIATLTGHVVRAYKCYTAVMDNGPARKKHVAAELQKAGDKVSDPAEISTVRREDYEMVKGMTEYEDILQCNNLPSSATPRGHQFPAAFMITASGLDEHGLDSEKKQIPYTHLDIAGSSGCIGTMPTAAPVSMLVSFYILPRL